MPAQTADSDVLPKVPDLRIAQCKFLLELEPGNEAVKKELLELVKTQNAAPIYQSLVKDLGWKMDKKLFDEMTKTNKSELATLQEKVEEAEKNHGESEIREALLAKAEYLTVIGEKKQAEECTAKTLEKTVGVGNRMDMIFNNIRIGLFFMDHKLIKENIEKANQMLEQGGDWVRFSLLSLN